MMYYFWAMVIAFGMCNRLFSLIRGIRKADQQSSWQDSEAASILHNSGVKATNLDRFSNLLRKYIVVPATFGYKCSQNIGWCTVPPRVQSLTIAAFILLNIVLCSVQYHAFSENM
jgi:hypothetical protein